MSLLVYSLLFFQGTFGILGVTFLVVGWCSTPHQRKRNRCTSKAACHAFQTQFGRAGERLVLLVYHRGQPCSTFATR